MHRQSFAAAVVSFIVGLFILILGIRVVFLLIGANQSSNFVSWIYRTSNSLIAPFQGIIHISNTGQTHSLDILAIIVIIIYALLGYLLILLLNALFGTSRRSHS